ncbi:MAG: Dabb family protein [Phycisphaerales bacterium]|nr:Dabb family protein [Phycisphaerales bacterium]
MPPHTTLAAMALVTVLVQGCSPVHTSGIEHVVLIKLDDPDRTSELLADCDRLLPACKGVVSYWSGTPDTSRTHETIDNNWDVALCVGYPDAEAYEAYVIDPKHVELVQTWREAIEWLRIHDVSLHHNLPRGSTLR